MANIFMYFAQCKILKQMIVLVVCLVSGVATANSLSFDEYMQQVFDNDQGLKTLQISYEQLQQGRISIDRLPDTEFTLSAKNIPAGHWQLNHDPMTHWQIGINQGFNRAGDIQLRQQKQQYLADAQPWLQQDRQALLRWKLGSQWIKAHFAMQRLEVIQQSEQVLTPLVDLVSNSYENGFKQVNQQSVIAAELALMRLTDNKFKWEQSLNSIEAELLAWLTPLASEITSVSTKPSVNTVQLQFQHLNNHLSSVLDVLSLPESKRSSAIYQRLMLHPFSQAQALQVKQDAVDIDLSKNKTTPKFAVSASYGLRSDQFANRELDDLFSVGVKVALPLFASEQLEAERQAAVLRTEAQRTERYLAIQTRFQRVNYLLVQLQSLQKRQLLYSQTLIPQISQQAEAALNAYTNDSGELVTALSAKLETLALYLEQLNLEEQQLVYLAELSYLLNEKYAQIQSHPKGDDQ